MTEQSLDQLRQAILSDYGVTLSDADLSNVAYSLLALAQFLSRTEISEDRLVAS